MNFSERTNLPCHLKTTNSPPLYSTHILKVRIYNKLYRNTSYQDSHTLQRKNKKVNAKYDLRGHSRPITPTFFFKSCGSDTCLSCPKLMHPTDYSNTFFCRVQWLLMTFNFWRSCNENSEGLFRNAYLRNMQSNYDIKHGCDLALNITSGAGMHVIKHHE